MSLPSRLLHRPFFIRLFNWEYWSFGTVYALIYPLFFFLCIRTKFSFFFSAANPKIKNGGFLMETKKEIYDQIPHHHFPKTLFFHANTPAVNVMNKIKERALTYPLIIKPDIGMKGYAVKKLENEQDLERIVPKFAVDFLVQEFVSYEKEAGVFYYRYPGEEKGHLSGIVSKAFLTVTGNGKDNLMELLKKDKRYVLQLPSLRHEYKDEMNTIFQNGEKKLLVPYGNHARGAKFIDDSHLIDEALTSVMEDFCKQVDEFWYGRLDIRYDNWEDLRQGKKFSVIELNGAGSEPTHMYDPKHSLFFAWKEIIRHWILLWRISRLNHKRGFPYMSFSEGRKMFREHRFYVKRLKAVHFSLFHL